MNKYNIKIFRKAGQLTTSIALVATFVAGVPSMAYAAENMEDEKILSENLEQTVNTLAESETITDTEVSFSGTYDTEKEAISAEENKKQEYSEKGYENIESEITQQTNESKETFEGIYDSEESAKKALNDYAQSVGGTVSSSEIDETKTEEDILYEEKIETIDMPVEDYVDTLNKKIEELNKTGYYKIEISEPTTIKEEVVIIVTVGNEKTSTIFGTKEEAETYINKMNAENSELKVVVNTLNINKELDGTINQSVEETFTSNEEALKRLEELKNSYDLKDSNIETVKSGDGSIISAEKYESSSRYELGDNNFFIIKQGSGSVAIWTLEELSEEEQATLISNYYTFNQDNKIDGSTTADKVSNVKFINGLGEFSLKELGNNWGEYTFSKQDGQVIMTCDSSRISHGIVGLDNRKISYKLTANYDQEQYKDVYEVITEITTKEKQTKEIEKTEMSYKIYEKLYSRQYFLNGEITIPIVSYLLKINGVKNIIIPETPEKPVPETPAEPAIDLISDEILETNNDINYFNKENYLGYAEMPTTGDNLPTAELTALALGAATVAGISGKRLVKKRK